MKRILIVHLLCTGWASAQPFPVPDPPPPEPSPPAVEPELPPSPPPLEPAPAPPAAEPAVSIEPVREVARHGFVSQGGFVSTSNDYLGRSSRGSLELFEAAINFSLEPADRLRVGLQLFARDLGKLGDYALGLDWAYIDYRWRPWLGLRAGHIKIPFGLYNEYTDIDAGRLPVLMPQSVYPTDSRDVLLAQTGVAGYGRLVLPGAGDLDYQVYGGTLIIPTAVSTTVRADEIDGKYVVGAQLFWRPPVDGLRIGASLLRTSIDYFLTLDQRTIDRYVALGLVPADYDGKAALFLRPATLVVGSAEYLRGRWLVAAEYSRWMIRSRAEPMLIPVTRSDSERFYGMVTYQLRDRVQTGAYYSVYFVDAGDRRGHAPRYPENFYAYQRDLAATIRFDVNDSWLWKLEAHFIDGAASLTASDNPDADRYWGMFFIKTTVSF